MKLENIINKPFLDTDRFDLQPVRCSDTLLIEFYFEGMRNVRIMSLIPHLPLAEDIEVLFERAMAEDRLKYAWAIDDKRSGLSETIGLVSILRSGKKQSELSFRITLAFWRKGVAPEVVKAITLQKPMRDNTVFAAVFF